ncbi:MAG: cupin domain-containing protein [Acetobacteraceae bacterium]
MARCAPSISASSARPARALAGTRTASPHHTLECQFVAVLDGWITVEVARAGRIRMQRGDAITIQPGRRHDVTGFSRDFPLLEINALTGPR